MKSEHNSSGGDEASKDHRCGDDNLNGIAKLEGNGMGGRCELTDITADQKFDNALLVYTIALGTD